MTDEEQKLDEILPCRKCGELDYEMWDGTGLWIAGLYCNNCDSQEEIELSGSTRSYEGVCVFDRKTQSHPKRAIARYKSALIKEWNRRATGSKEAELQAEVEKLREALENSHNKLHNLLCYFERGSSLSDITRRDGIECALDLNKQALKKE